LRVVLTIEAEWCPAAGELQISALRDGRHAGRVRLRGGRAEVGDDGVRLPRGAREALELAAEEALAAALASGRLPAGELARLAWADPPIASGAALADQLAASLLLALTPAASRRAA
jgi:hypothetical protein